MGWKFQMLVLSVSFVRNRFTCFQWSMSRMHVNFHIHAYIMVIHQQLIFLFVCSNWLLGSSKCSDQCCLSVMAERESAACEDLRQGYPCFGNHKNGGHSPEPTWHMDDVLTVRPEVELQVQGRRPWADEAVSAGAQPSEGHYGSTGAICSTDSVHRGAGERQDDGAQGVDAAKCGDKHNVHAYDLGRVSREVEGGHESAASALCQVSSGNTRCSAEHGCECSVHQAIEHGERAAEEQIVSGGGDSDRSPSQNRTACGGVHEAEGSSGQAECRDGSDACIGQVLGCTQGDSQWLPTRDQEPGWDQRGSPGNLRRGEPREQEEVSGATKTGVGLWSLWDRLKKLRGSMARHGEPTTPTPRTTTPDGELVKGSQSLEESPKQPDDGFCQAVNRLHQIYFNGSTNPALPPLQEQQKNSKKADNTQSKKNIVMPNLAQRLATSVAVFGATLALPVQGLMAQLQDAPDFVEVACAPTSALTAQMESMGYSCKRISFKGGYDLSSKIGTTMLRNEFQLHPPKFSWVSLPCTRLSPLQNLTERTEAEWSQFEKRVGRDLKRADEVAEAIEQGLDFRPDSDFAWEWPTGGVKGWRRRCIQRLLKKMQKRQRPVFWCRFHGCAYGLEYHGLPVLKGWTILTSNRKLWMSLQKKCPGHPEHAQCRGILLSKPQHTIRPRW